jgi:hypothetical protein
MRMDLLNSATQRLRRGVSFNGSQKGDPSNNDRSYKKLNRVEDTMKTDGKPVLSLCV